MTLTSIAHWFIAPAGSSTRAIRSAGVRSFVLGALLVTAIFIAAIRDHNGSIVAMLNGRGGLMVIAGIVVSYLFAAQGGFRLVTGVARGDTSGDSASTAIRVLRVIYLVVMGVGWCAVTFGAVAVITPHVDEPAVATPVTHDLEVPLPDEHTQQIHIMLDGGGILTITRVNHDGGAQQHADAATSDH